MTTATETKPTTALATIDKPMALQPQEFSAFGNITHFENAQRMAKALCSSAMVPETYRGEQNLGSCMIALEISNRIGANVLAVMQNLYIVYGKPAWSSQFLIACVNASQKFTPLRYRMTGTPNTDSFGCVAWAKDKTGELLDSPEITIGMAKAEGWYQKNGSKWKTMPELMLRYRTATLFARLYAPELTMGIRTDDEIIDIVEVAPVVTEARPSKSVATSPDFSAPVDVAPEPPKAPEAPAPLKARGPRAVKPAPTAPQAVQPAPVAETVTPTPELLPTPTTDPGTPLDDLQGAMILADVFSGQVLAFYNQKVRGANPEITELSQLPPQTMATLTKALRQGVADIVKAIKAFDPV